MAEPKSSDGGGQMSDSKKRRGSNLSKRSESSYDEAVKRARTLSPSTPPAYSTKVAKSSSDSGSDSDGSKSDGSKSGGSKSDGSSGDSSDGGKGKCPECNKAVKPGDQFKKTKMHKWCGKKIVAVERMLKKGSKEKGKKGKKAAKKWKRFQKLRVKNPRSTARS